MYQKAEALLTNTYFVRIYEMSSINTRSVLYMFLHAMLSRRKTYSTSPWSRSHRHQLTNRSYTPCTVWRVLGGLSFIRTWRWVILHAYGVDSCPFNALLTTLESFVGLSWPSCIGLCASHGPEGNRDLKVYVTHECESVWGLMGRIYTGQYSCCLDNSNANLKGNCTENQGVVTLPVVLELPAEISTSEPWLM